MNKEEYVLKKMSGDILLFRCPGCKIIHQVQVGKGSGPRWTWNKAMVKPTFTPSVLVKYSKLTEEGEKQAEEWRNNDYKPIDMKFDNQPVVCHSYVREGKIQFLSDCTHSLSNKTVDLPRWIE